MIEKRNMKKGSLLIEIGIGLVVLASIAAFFFFVFSSKKEDMLYKNTMNTFMTSFYEGMISYSDDSTLTKNDFTSASATNVASFMSQNVVVLSGTYLTPTEGKLKDLVKVTVNPARDSGGNSNKRYKVMFDISDYATSVNWSPEEKQKAENEIGKFFKNVSPDGLIIAGATTTLPDATTDATASNPNTDGIIVIDKVK